MRFCLLLRGSGLLLAGFVLVMPWSDLLLAVFGLLLGVSGLLLAYSGLSFWPGLVYMWLCHNYLRLGLVYFCGCFDFQNQFGDSEHASSENEALESQKNPNYLKQCFGFKTGPF